MSRKIKPNLFRLNTNKPWMSRWFYSKRNGRFFLEEDTLIRKVINDKMKNVGIDSVSIERTRDDIQVFIKSSKPGLIVGRGGKGIETLKGALDKKIMELRKERNLDINYGLRLNVVEMGRYEMSARSIAEQIAADLERRIPFRVVLKRQMRLLEQNRDIKGVKTQVSGRLNGADIARTEWLDHGKMPLNNLRADIDYGEAISRTTFGTIGVKVWLFKGEIFEEEK